LKTQLFSLYLGLIFPTDPQNAAKRNVKNQFSIFSSDIYDDFARQFDLIAQYWCIYSTDPLSAQSF